MLKSVKTTFSFIKSTKSKLKKRSDDKPESPVENTSAEPTSPQDSEPKSSKSKHLFSKLLFFGHASPTTTPVTASSPSFKKTLIYSEIPESAQPPAGVQSPPVLDGKKTLDTNNEAMTSKGPHHSTETLNSATEIDSFDIGINLSAHDLGTGIATDAVPMGSIFSPPASSSLPVDDDLNTSKHLMGKTAAAIAAVQKKEKRISWKMPEVASSTIDEITQVSEDMPSSPSNQPLETDSVLLEKSSSVASVSRAIREAVITPMFQPVVALQSILKQPKQPLPPQEDEGIKTSTIGSNPAIIRVKSSPPTAHISRPNIHPNVSESASEVHAIRSPVISAGEVTSIVLSPLSTSVIPDKHIASNDPDESEDLDRPLLSEEEFLACSFNSNSNEISANVRSSADMGSEAVLYPPTQTPSSGSRFRSMDRTQSSSHHPFRISPIIQNAQLPRDVNGSENGSRTLPRSFQSKKSHFNERTSTSSDVPKTQMVSNQNSDNLRAIASSVPNSYLAKQNNGIQASASQVDALAYLSPDEKALIEEYRRKREAKRTKEDGSKNSTTKSVMKGFRSTNETPMLSSSVPVASTRRGTLQNGVMPMRQDETGDGDLSAPFLQDQKKIRSIRAWVEESSKAGAPPEHPHQLHVHHPHGDHPHHQFLPEMPETEPSPSLQRQVSQHRRRQQYQTTSTQPERQVPQDGTRVSHDERGSLKRRKSKRKPLVDLSEPSSVVDKIVSLRRKGSQTNKGSSYRATEVSSSHRPSSSSAMPTAPTSSSNTISRALDQQTKNSNHGASHKNSNRHHSHHGAHERRGSIPHSEVWAEVNAVEKENQEQRPLDEVNAVARKQSLSRRSKRVTPVPATTSDDSEEENLPLGKLVIRN